MRRNRRIKHTRVTVNSMGVVTLILVAFFSAIVYWTVDSRCKTLIREIGKSEKKLASLEADFQRETMLWEEMKTPDRLNEALVRFGIEMKTAEPDQTIHMGANGKPLPGQLSVARARNRKSKTETVAQSAVRAPTGMRTGAKAPRRHAR